MLLSFTVSNFRSFRAEQTLSMVASNRQTDHPEHLTAIPEDENKVLPIAAIYGANGAGKSNTVRALRLLQMLVTRGTSPKKKISRQAFRLAPDAPDSPTEFNAAFINNRHVLNYGVQLTDDDVVAEWLFLVVGGKEISVFERVTRQGGDVVVEPGDVLTDDTWGGRRENEKVVALAKVGVLPNQLFLHAVGKTLRERDQGPVLGAALSWFQDSLSIVKADATFANLAGLVSDDSEFANFAGDFLRKVATGVSRLDVSISEVEESVLSGLHPEAQRAIGELPAGETTTFTGPDGTEVIVQKQEGTKVRVRTVQAEHLTSSGSAVKFPFSEESDGTQRLTHLLPSLFHMRSKPVVYVIDEIDRSLHPLLSKGFVREFLKECAAKGSQLIFTTHDTSFLDLDLLRRDEIWFAEKNPTEGSTDLYSLADFKVRKDLKIDKGYLQGRFGAVPPLEHEMPEWVGRIIDELKPNAGQSPASAE